MTNTNFTLETQQLVVDRNFGENCFFAWELDQKFDDSDMSVYIYECEATAWYWLSINTREVQELLILIVALIFNNSFKERVVDFGCVMCRMKVIHLQSFVFTFQFLHVLCYCVRLWGAVIQILSDGSCFCCWLVLHILLLDMFSAEKDQWVQFINFVVIRK